MTKNIILFVLGLSGVGLLLYFFLKSKDSNSTAKNSAIMVSDPYGGIGIGKVVTAATNYLPQSLQSVTKSSIERVLQPAVNGLDPVLTSSLSLAADFAKQTGLFSTIGSGLSSLFGGGSSSSSFISADQQANMLAESFPMGDSWSTGEMGDFNYSSDELNLDMVGNEDYSFLA